MSYLFSIKTTRNKGLSFINIHVFAVITKNNNCSLVFIMDVKKSWWSWWWKRNHKVYDICLVERVSENYMVIGTKDSSNKIYKTTLLKIQNGLIYTNPQNEVYYTFIDPLLLGEDTSENETIHKILQFIPFNTMTD